jgi:uncharacterized membrane protein YtjA (UPF0391 family)
VTTRGTKNCEPAGFAAAKTKISRSAREVRYPLVDRETAGSAGEANTQSKNLRVRSLVMLHWALVFLVIALIAGVLGFSGVYVAASGIAKVLFFVFLVLFVISLFTHRRSLTV